MEQKFSCKLTSHPGRKRFEVHFSRRFTEERHKFGALVGYVERELGLKGRIASGGDGREWWLPFGWFTSGVPTVTRVVEVIKRAFQIYLEAELEVTIVEIETGPVFDPVTDQVAEDDEPLVDGLALSPGDLP